MLLSNLKFVMVASLVATTQAIPQCYNFLALVDMDAVNDALLPVYWSFLMKVMNGAKLADMDHQHGSMQDINFYVTQDALNLSVSQSPVNPLTMRLRAENVSFGFTSDKFIYKLGLIESDGKRIEAEFRDVTFEVDVRLTTLDNETFAVVVENVDIDLPSDHLDLTLYDSYFYFLARPFKYIYEQELRVQLEKQIEERVRNIFPALLNRKIALLQNQATAVSETDVFDWRLYSMNQEVLKDSSQRNLFNNRLYFTLKGFRKAESAGFHQMPESDHQSQDCQQMQMRAFYPIAQKGINDTQAFKGYFVPSQEALWQSDELVKFDLDNYGFNAESFLEVFHSSDKHERAPLPYGEYDHSDKKVVYLASDNLKIAPDWLPQGGHQKLPQLNNWNWLEIQKIGSFASEHLNAIDHQYNKMFYGRVTQQLHQWISQHYDKLGFVKAFEKVFMLFFKIVMFLLYGKNVIL